MIVMKITKKQRETSKPEKNEIKKKSPVKKKAKKKADFVSKFELFKKPKKLPKFKIGKKKAIILLPDEFKSFRYALIPPFSYAKITKDEEGIHYNVTEPKLNKKEKEDYEKIVSALIEVIDIELTAIKEKGKTIEYLQEQIQKVVHELDVNLDKKSHNKIMYYIYRDFVGLNELEPLFHDPYIEDISCNGVGIPLYIVHRKYGSLKSNIVYKDEDELKEFIVKLAERTGRFISYAEPLLDGSLPDGSRIQASFSKDVTSHGPTFTIRKFTEIPFSPIDMMNNKTVGAEVLAYLWLAIESGSSILIAGGTGTGKTSMLNILTMFIPKNKKIITVEDTRELQLPHENWIPSVTRMGFTKEYGEVTMFDLLRESFRQSPDYVIVGEVRGKETYVMFQGMAAGMPSIGTMHAGKVDDVINRLETPPINLSSSLIETLDLIIIMSHARNKGESARRLKEVVEIESVDQKTGIARTNRIYTWLPSTDSFEKRGYSWMLQEISKHKGIPLEELQTEIMQRTKVLTWLSKQKNMTYKDVSDLLSEYMRDKQKILKKVV
jgi:flagellar protein FlaI